MERRKPKVRPSKYTHSEDGNRAYWNDVMGLMDAVLSKINTECSERDALLEQLRPCLAYVNWGTDCNSPPQPNVRPLGLVVEQQVLVITDARQRDLRAKVRKMDFPETRKLIAAVMNSPAAQHIQIKTRASVLAFSSHILFGEILPEFVPNHIQKWFKVWLRAAPRDGGAASASAGGGVFHMSPSVAATQLALRVDPVHVLEKRSSTEPLSSHLGDDFGGYGSDGDVDGFFDKPPKKPRPTCAGEEEEEEVGSPFLPPPKEGSSSPSHIQWRDYGGFGVIGDDDDPFFPR